MTLVSLADLRAGESAKVSRISGGWGVQRRLEALGIRSGAIVTKISSSFRPGAIVVAAGGGQAALGYGIARKVFVEVNP